MRGDIQHRYYHEQPRVQEPQGAVEQAKRLPVEHDRRQVQGHMREHDAREQGLAPLDLLHIIDPVPERRINQKKETAQPERLAFPAEQQEHADHDRRNAQRVNDPSKFQGVALEEPFTQGKMDDQDDLIEERPNDEQGIQGIQTKQIFTSRSGFPIEIPSRHRGCSKYQAQRWPFLLRSTVPSR
jgi:hypothetical protein